MTFIERPALDEWIRTADELLLWSLETEEEAAQDSSETEPA